MWEKNTVGGVIEVIAINVPAGLGSHVHWERKLDGRLAQAVMSIPSVKGVEIGPAFENARHPGTEVHDEIYLAPASHTQWNVTRRTNRAGGLAGGITNGMPIVIRAALKPVATTATPLHSVDVATGEEAMTQYQRSDYCHIPRACVIAETMVAWVLADALLEKAGGDSLTEMRERIQND